MSALVEARGLALPDRLEATDIAIEGGALCCLAGPNGSGKTSLLHALAGIGRPEGEVRIGGNDPRPAPPALRRRLLSYLPASREMVWPLTARDVVALGDPEGAGRALAMLDLAGMAERRLDRMSTGERSRVLIARALAADPLLLLLDEPVSNLDPLWQLRLMELLRDIARSGRAVLVAVHDLELARTYADRLIVMESGRIAADGEPEALLEGPLVRSVFGIERVGGGWRPVRRPEDRRSSP